ncbi:hypothetical protein CEUSTIGMA_g5282.t1 [Chlamydomonas eustigma]|uniref:GPI mannosyltransferase 2 n=1 Tax=Chlamydomonas eustigma TaxID=1157962 RepID=A0A250X502_9CHLO|nr:hypothetical protein CEUSTIGMA_g5282.t1 [Chlamydomonas eustigma]|eukprot:GAX77840.1 hypothetical protein CEUSTIGMA_g5282.t1 [Chlamydomonas eustigma]
MQNEPIAWRVATLTFLIRSLQFILLALSDHCFSDYDTSKLLLQSVDRLHNAEEQIQTSLSVPALSSGHITWDSVFFLEISKRGYEHEQFYAFFPLFPALSGLLGPSMVPVIALLICVTSSVVMATLFASLSQRILQNPEEARMAVLCLILNQACTFHTVAYSESLFGALTMAGLYCLYCQTTQGSRKWSGDSHLDDSAPPPTKQEPDLSTLLGTLTPISQPKRLSFTHLFAAAFFFTLGSCTRANGIINCGYVAHVSIEGAIQAWSRQEVTRSFLYLVLGALSSALVAAPLAVHQVQGFRVFCTNPPTPSSIHTTILGVEAGTGIADAEQDGLWRPWCSEALPRIYSFVQEHYWGIGWFKYWRLEQAPNFLLASPALMLTWCGVWSYLSANPRHLLTGGFQKTSASLRNFTTTSQALPKSQKGHTPIGEDLGASSMPEAIGLAGEPGGFHGLRVAVHIYPWAFMSILSLLVMHVQVSTRFLSCCPALYWFLAHLLTKAETDQSSVRHNNAKGRGMRGGILKTGIWGVSLIYIALGTLLFPNFYPWT